MSKNVKNIFYKTLAMSNDINVGEGWEGGNLNRKQMQIKS
jgi:hypothetical protein